MNPDLKPILAILGILVLTLSGFVAMIYSAIKEDRELAEASPKCPNCKAPFYHSGKFENWCNNCKYREHR